jgi:fluoroacetyl-CoA thioesterase
MPEVFATGFLVGFLEWACVLAIKPHLDWPEELTLGTHIDVSHEAATPPGLEVTATVELSQWKARSSRSKWRRTTAWTSSPRAATNG